jgi:hypothetical protein
MPFLRASNYVMPTSWCGRSGAPVGIKGKVFVVTKLRKAKIHPYFSSKDRPPEIISLGAKLEMAPNDLR